MTYGLLVSKSGNSTCKNNFTFAGLILVRTPALAGCFDKSRSREPKMGILWWNMRSLLFQHSLKRAKLGSLRTYPSDAVLYCNEIQKAGIQINQ
jgi:hypothetical protein